MRYSWRKALTNRRNNTNNMDTTDTNTTNTDNSNSMEETQHKDTETDTTQDITQDATVSQKEEEEEETHTPSTNPLTSSHTHHNDSSSSSDEEEEDNEDGTDHAEDLPNSNITWMPQSIQSTCEFIYNIKNYSQKRESGCKKAEYSQTTIDSHGNRWRLIIYVNGNGRASNHHLSLFLQVADAEDLPFGWRKSVSYVLTLEHPSESHMGYAKRNPDKTFKLCPKAIDWGWSQFITSDKIQQDGYIENDSLTVRASVTVRNSSISIDPEDAELYLKCAVEEGDSDAVNACLKQGASVNCQFKDDLYTPLHTACSSSASDGSLDVLNLLLEKGADGNACNKWKETPLLIAANNGHKAAVEALLNSGADPSMCSEAGWSALTFAAHKGYDEIVTLLLKAKAPMNCRVIEDLSTPLHKACAGSKEGHLSAVKQLLEVGADVHALNKWRETPLLTAANHGQASAVEALLDAGADPCKCTDTGWSPLSIAAYKGHDEVVELLLDHGAPTEEEDPTLSALLQAATKGLPNTVELLLRNGADHTVTTKKGDTALSILVEQDLIDAAVEMVTEYKASIPRCSRDRKKVQRARLLINLQIKKQKERGDYWDEDDSDQDDADEEANLALHDQEENSTAISTTSSASNKKKKKKKRGKKKGISAAEEKANAAADALLLELEEESAKAQQEEAAATSKRNKKKKKKERERQQKQEQERIRKEKEQEEARKRAELKRQKDAEERKLREEKMKQQKEKELKEAADRQKKAAQKQKEKEAKEKLRLAEEKRQQEQQEKERKEKEKIEKKRLAKEQKRLEALKKEAEEKRQQEKKDEALAANSQNEASATVTRGWERAETPDAPNNVDNAIDSSKSTVEDDLENMANGMVGFLDFDEIKSALPEKNGNASNVDNKLATAQHAQFPPVQSVSAAILRHEKIMELLQTTTAIPHSSHPLSCVSTKVLKTIIYKWITRASYESTEFMDPLIPSWIDRDFLIAFMQRQLISEGRKSSNGMMNNVESLKEAGQFLADLCLSQAEDVHKLLESNNVEISDSSENISAREIILQNGNRGITVECNGHSVILREETFLLLRHRYVGRPDSFLTAMFGLLKRYETFGIIIEGIEAEHHLPRATLETLAGKLKANIDLWTDSLSVYTGNTFCGIFNDVDCLFGALPSYLGRESVLDNAIRTQGGSVVVHASHDSTTASLCAKKILDVLETSENVALTFTMFLATQAFRDLQSSPTFENLKLIEPRLLQSHQHFISRAEILRAGTHSFSIDGCAPCSNDSIMLILQNQVGREQIQVTDEIIYAIMNSFSATNETVFGNGNMGGSMNESSIPVQSLNHFNDVSDINLSSRASNINSSRRRFFDLVEDEEDNVDDYFGNADAMVEGMLSSLDISLFQDGNSSSNVDIEAISLMGFNQPNNNK